jgi:enterochelin esterase-like enzyme
MATNRLSYWIEDPETVSDIQLFLIEAIFGKADVRPGRIVASVVVFGFLYLLVTEAWRPLRRGLGWFLLPLGQSALYAYAAHIVIVVPLSYLLDQATIQDRFSRPLNAGIQIAVLLLIWALIRWRVLFVNPTAGYARYAWPAAALLTCMVLIMGSPAPLEPGLTASAAGVDESSLRMARAFGTPVPGRPPPSEGTPVPLPPPRPSLRQAQVPALNAMQRASRYVGPVKGRFEQYQFFSPALGRDTRYFVYLPPEYNDSSRRFPVLYMLHGNSGSFEEWPAYGLISAADRMIAAREILPLIIVLPQGDWSYWVNHAGGGPKYGDYTRTDLVNHVDAVYRTIPDPTHRAIGGLSMGGTGALINAFTHPELFGVVGAHSPALPEEGSRDFLGVGQEFVTKDPLQLASSARGLRRLHIWIDVGDEDSWLERAERLYESLEARDVDHEFRIFPGDHWGPYWSEHISDYLHFYDAALNPQQRL